MTASANPAQHTVSPTSSSPPIFENRSFPSPTTPLPTPIIVPTSNHLTSTNLNPQPALVCVVPKDKLTVSGPLKKWEGKGSSGKSVWRWFCADCGSPIAHDPDAAPEIIAIKAGTLDTEIKKTLKPDTEIWTVGKLPFCQEHLEKPFEHMPN